MYSLKLVLTIAFILCSVVVKSCDLYDTDTATCAKDLEDICGVTSFPDSIQTLYDSRNCLRKNQDLLSKDCADYLELDKPSIIDSCFVEMKSYCLNITPGGFRIHACLSAQPKDDLSLNCQKALAYDQQMIQEKGTSESGEQFSADFWKTWASYIAQVTKSLTGSTRMVLTPYFSSRYTPVINLRGGSAGETSDNDDGATTDDDHDESEEESDSNQDTTSDTPSDDNQEDDDSTYGGLRGSILSGTGEEVKASELLEESSSSPSSEEGGPIIQPVKGYVLSLKEILALEPSSNKN